MKRLLSVTKGWIEYLAGSKSHFDFEHRFLNLIMLLAGFVCGLTILVNQFLLGMGGLMVWIILSLWFYFWILYFLSRFQNLMVFSKWMMTIVLYPVFTYIFIINNGSEGPLLYLYIVFFLLILFIWDGYPRIFFIILFIINLGLLAFIELRYDDLIDPYASKELKMIDVYVSYVIYMFLGGVILISAKSNYIRERKKAQESDKLKSAFLANMSHEIRTPMNAIIGFSQLLEGDVSEEQKQVYIQTIKDNGQSLLRLIEDIIDISKIEAGQVEIKNSKVDIKALLDALKITFEQFRIDHNHLNVEILNDAPDHALVVETDGERLKQILANLLNNAFRYTEAGSIRFGYKIEGPRIGFYVKDTGRGISKEHLEEIFERFRKIELEHANKIHRGTGIGLSISKNLVHLLGGEIWVESELGKGSVFNFTIPYLPTEPESSSSEEKEALTVKKFVGNTILIVEDEDANYQFLKSYLNRFDVNIIWVDNGEEAVDLVRAQAGINLVLMDIRMPVMNGLEATRKIREFDKKIPIIAQTAMAMAGDRKESLEAGCDDYITKPINVPELTEIIHKYLKLESD